MVFPRLGVHAAWMNLPALLAEFVAFGGDGIIGLFVNIVVVGLIAWLLLWAIAAIGIPEPFNKVARVLIIVFSVLWLLNVLLGLGGHGHGFSLH